MRDGCRLSARIWLPEDAAALPVPAILEYIPYRKDDATAARDAAMHPYFAAHGYGAVRVDLRGSGDSEGVLTDEYLPLEQEDGLEVLAWLAAQPWCTGKVGMIGKSWGGFNALQIAAHGPPELKAVISVASTDDRYAEDVHYMGGCLLAWDILSWASTMLAYNARPPDPEIVGAGWRELWMERLAGSVPFVDAWLAHQRRDEYWRQGSVCEDYGAIECPVYMVGGWADAYRSAVLRFLERAPGEHRGLIGPWGHLYPHQGSPAPAIGFLQEALRWWDRWLKGIDNGITEEPKLRVWMQEAVEPAPSYAQRPGRWLGASGWPAEDLEGREFRLEEDRLDDSTDRSSSEAALEWRGTQLVGADAGIWCPWGGETDFPLDQRREDGLSLAFTSLPLDERVEVLGFPTVHLALSVDQPLALVAVRLCDVGPDGASTLVTRGLLNLTHRLSHERPSELAPGRRYQVRVRLDAIAYALPPGHRLRVSVSPTYWPWAWPSPRPVTLTLFTGPDSRLELPVYRGRRLETQPPPHFDRPERPAERAARRLPPYSAGRREVRYEIGTREQVIVHELGYLQPVRILETGTDYVEQGSDLYSIVDGEPLSARTESRRSIAISRGSWRTRVETTSTLTSTAEAFLVSNLLEAFEGSRRVFVRSWHGEHPRELV
jgi:putative CocE/NonD family hydrolase